jgi:hypothetical protein
MIAGILAGVVLESMTIIVLPEPSTLGILFVWATNDWFYFCVYYSMIVTTIRVLKDCSSLRIMAGIICCCFITPVFILVALPSPGITPDLPKAYTGTERTFSDEVYIWVVLFLARIILFCLVRVLAGVLLTTTRSQHWSFNRYLFLLRHVIVFFGACSFGANTCLFIACLIGALPAVYEVTTFVSLVVCHSAVSLLLIVVSWTQEKIMFEEMETSKSRETKKKEGGDTLEYSFIW